MSGDASSIHVPVVSGSLRRGSYNTAALRAARELLRKFLGNLLSWTQRLMPRVAA